MDGGAGVLNITIEDTQTGGIIRREASYLVMATVEEKGCCSILEGSASADEIIKAYVAIDHNREELFRSRPLLGILYTFRDKIYQKNAVIDVAELERQAKGGSE